MPPAEGLALYRAGLEAAPAGPLLEIGTYCGKSAIYLGAAARERATVVFTIDHHRGSEEIQPGWEHHDPELVDEDGRMDSLPFFRRAIAQAGLEDVVVAIVGRSTVVAAHWSTPLGLVFVDGAHSEEDAIADVLAWSEKLAPGGLLAVHDVFEDPADGGQGPYRAWLRAKDTGAFEDAGGEGSLRILRRLR